MSLRDYCSVFTTLALVAVAVEMSLQINFCIFCGTVFLGSQIPEEEEFHDEISFGC